MADLSNHTHYRQQFVRCGKDGCKRCAAGPGHGPYWYAVWRDGGRVRSRYIGKNLPDGAEGSVMEPAPAVASGQIAAAGRPKRPAQSVEPGPGASAPPAPGAPRLRIWILGRFSVESAGVMVPESAWRRQAATVVLKLLLLADFRRLPREHISAQIWPEADADTARSQMASAVHVLRRALEPGLATGTPSRYLVQEGASLVLRLGEDDWVDYLAFESLLAAAVGAPDPLALLEQASALYGGDLMPEEQNPWCVAAREGLRLRRHGMLLALAEAQAAHRQFDAAASTLTQLLAANPSLEEAARRLMGLLGRQGRRSEALKLYERLRAALEEDMDAEPAADTVALAEALRAGTAPRRQQTRPVEAAVLESARPAMPALVGRQGEMNQLRAAMLAARDGQGRFLLLTGDAGIGKSRIADEAATIAVVLGFAVLWGRAAESEQELPYAPIAEAIRTYIHTRPPAALRRDLAGAEAVRSIVPEVAAILPNLAELPALELPGAERLRLWMAVRTLLAAATERQPLLLILEDLHWADKESLGLLTFLMRRVRESRLVVLVTIQGEVLPDAHALFLLMSEGRREETLTVLPVGGLSPEEGLELVQGQLGATLSADQAAALYSQCTGNPLCIKEMLALFREPDRRRRDDLLAAVAAGTAEVPTTILLTLRQRLERRSADCRALLRIGAAIGERFSLDLLAQVAELTPDAFDRAVAEAVDRGLLREDIAGLTGDYMLSHSLLRRVLYEELAPNPRRRLHARIGAALVEAVSADSAPNAAAIAHHFGLSNDLSAAVTWFERAGDRAAELYAWPDAQAHYKRAHDLSERPAAFPDLDATGVQVVTSRLTEKLGNLLLLEGEYAAAQVHFARARVLVHDSAPRAELWRKEGVTWEKQGDVARALASPAAAEIAGAAPSENDAGERAELLHKKRKLPAEVEAELELSRADVYWNQEAFDAAAGAAERALLVLTGQPEGSALARAYYLLGHVAELRRDLQKAEECYERSLAIRERIEDYHGMGTCWYGLGMVAYDSGDPGRAEACHQQALAIRERIGDPWGVAFSWGKLGQLAQFQGHYARAEACNRRSHELRAQLGNQPAALRAAYRSSHAAVEQGDYAEAAGYLERGLRMQERVGDQWGCSTSLSDLGDVTRERGDFSLAEHYIGRSLALKEHLGDQLGIVQCLHGLGLLAGERGDLGAANRLGQRARRLARRIGAHGMEATASLGQATTALKAGRLRLAGPLLAHCRALAEYTSTRTGVEVSLAEATLFAAQNRPAEAAEAARDALHSAVSNQFRREEGLAQRRLGQCRLAVGDPAGAAVLLRTACQLLERIGAAAELNRTEAILASTLNG